MVSLSLSHRQHVMTLLVHNIILLWDVEFPEEVEGDDGVAVDNDGQQHACQDQLWEEEEEEVLKVTVGGVVLSYYHCQFYHLRLHGLHKKYNHKETVPTKILAIKEY